MTFIDPKQHMIASLLPRFVFITGPNGSGKTTLARQLFDNVKGLQAHSFAEPIREAVRGLLFLGDIGMDLHSQLLKDAIVAGNKSVRQITNGMGDWVRDFFGPEALGQMALNRCNADADYFERFVFDDVRRLTDVMPIIREHGRESCLLIKLSRPGVTFDQPNHFRHDESLLMACPSVEFVNDKTIPHMLSGLAEKLIDFLTIPSTIAQSDESNDRQKTN